MRTANRQVVKENLQVFMWHVHLCSWSTGIVNACVGILQYLLLEEVCLALQWDYIHEVKWVGDVIDFLITEIQADIWKWTQCTGTWGPSSYQSTCMATCLWDGGLVEWGQQWWKCKMWCTCKEHLLNSKSIGDDAFDSIGMSAMLEVTE